MSVTDPSGASLAADEAAFSQAMAEAMAINDRRQQQAAGFQDREAPGDVTAGQEQVNR